MYENNSIYLLCELLEQNIADEADARVGYYKILNSFNNYLSESEKAQLYEIIAEELKHSNILTEMIYRRTGIVAED